MAKEGKMGTAKSQEKIEHFRWNKKHLIYKLSDGKKWGVRAISPEWELEILIECIKICIGLREPEKKLFWPLKPFSKLKTTFCNYWTSVKIKISMIYEVYKVKIKMVQKQWLQLKLKFLLGYNMKIVGDSRRDINITQGFFFQVGRNK